MRLFTINPRIIKAIAVFFLQVMAWEIFFPVSAYALTGGPSQPEVESFEPVGTTEMVDLFSGDFVYNIPLMDVEGMPVNISYHSGITMDQEASWVGLGWNINPGAVTRQLRGLPDDFKGEEVQQEINVKPFKSWRLSASSKLEISGRRRNGKKVKDFEVTQPNFSMKLGVKYDNYVGLGYELSAFGGITTNTFKDNDLTLGLGLTAASYSGFDYSASAGIQREYDKIKNKRNYSIGLGIRGNTLEGLEAMTLNVSKGLSNGKNGVPKRYGLSRMSGFGGTTYTPQLMTEYINRSQNYSLSTGLYGLVTSWGPSLDFHRSKQEIINRSQSVPAYGYYYSHEVGKTKNPFVMDFNRINDGPYIKSREYLAYANFTYDIFNIAGEGTGGVFRPFRNDVGVTYDADRENRTTGLGLGVGVEKGDLVKLELDVNGNLGKSRSGRWYKDKLRNTDFDIIKRLDFKQNDYNNDPRQENVFFKVSGEKGQVDQNYFNTLAGDQPYRVGLDYTNARARSELTEKNQFGQEITGDVRMGRDKRNTLVTHLNNDEAQLHALDKKIRIYEHNTFTMDPENNSLIYDEEENRPAGEQMSEFTVTNPDGRRYVYGIPAKNHTQKNATFNVVDPGNPTLTKDETKGLVTYSSGDNSLGNTKGVDNYYSATTLPSYAHSFLLTSILSDDYVDVKGDGITDDDLGTAVKMNYKRTDSHYKWRTPYSRGGHEAFYNEGYKNEKYDDKGSYIYGEKEIWYLHSIESKNYIACFYTSKRMDACGVNGENGIIDTTENFHKLDSIKLFTKLDLLLSGDNAIPIKTVHFEYDYSLCPAIPNHSLNTLSPGSYGKLTLKKIYFTYGKSKKGKLSPYQFTYSNSNPSYTMRGYDRWGHYKPSASNADIQDVSNKNKALSNDDDPYVTMDREDADEFAQAWSLTQIKLPSGGYINVQYESDDYAYVQDKEAMQMFKVTGAGTSTTFSDANILYDEKQSDLYNKARGYLFFDLPETITPYMDLDSMKRAYFPADGEKIFFKFLLKLSGNNITDALGGGDDDKDYEFVNGFMEIEDKGFINKSGGSGYNAGYIKVKKMNDRSDGKDKGTDYVHPVSKTAWQFMKASQPDKIHQLFSEYEPQPDDKSNKAAIASLAGSLEEAKLMFTKLYREMQDKEVAKEFVINKSFLRLKSPGKKRTGGGVRVKKITISDSWSDMVNGTENAVYGQEFNYETTEKDAQGDEKMISSGVASYEPGTGKEENPYTGIEEYREKKIWAPDNRFTVETPILDALFPAPEVGYSKVTTRNIKPVSNIKRTATGYTVNEFYTAKDFPTVIRSSAKRALPNLASPSDNKFKQGTLKALRFIGRLLALPTIDREFATQGYYIQHNDMHGKPKAEWSFEEGNPQAISGVTYHYKSQVENGVNVLSDEVSVLKRDGIIETAHIGRETDMVVDLRWAKSQNMSGSIQNNLNIKIGRPGFNFIPHIQYEEKEFGSAVTTKVIHRYGILEEVKVYDQSASVSTKNLLFDAETGQVLLTQTTNEFNDPIYSFTYPAYFAHIGMAPAYLTAGVLLHNVTFDKGVITVANSMINYRNFITAGDELMITKVIDLDRGIRQEHFKARVWAVTSPHISADLVFMTRSGHLVDLDAPLDGHYNVKVIRSGHRNLQSVPMGTITTLKNPIVGNTLVFDEVLNSSAAEFSDSWASSYRTVERSVALPKAEDPDDPANDPGSPEYVDEPCDMDCYEGMIELLTDPGTMPYNIFNMTEGDVIDLTKPPYNTYYNCMKDSKQDPCRPFSTGSTLTRIDLLPPGYAFSASWQDFSNYAGVNSRQQPEENKKQNKKEELFRSMGTIDLVRVGLRGYAFQGFGPGKSAELTTEKNLSGETGALLKTMDDVCDPIDSASCDDVKYLKIGNCVLVIGIKQVLCVCSSGTCVTTSTESHDCSGKTVTSRYVYTGTCPADEHKYLVRTKMVCGSSASDLDTTVVEAPASPVEGGEGNCNYQYAHSTVNPYVQGIKGKWRANRSWVFYDKRDQSSSSGIRKNGTYLNYHTFWNKPVTGNNWYKSASNDLADWRATTVATLQNRTGNEIENVNALNIYSAALFGYGQSLAKAVGNNMKYRQLAFDGFEDYDCPYDIYEDHLSFRGYRLADTAHTGKKSLGIAAGTAASVTRPLLYLENVTPYTADGGDNHYYKQALEDMPLFCPDSGRYLLSCWVKEEVSCATGYTQDTAIVTIQRRIVSAGDTSYRDTTFRMLPSGYVIEGWQRVEGNLYVPSDAICIKVTLKAGSNDCFFDDLRIFPVRGNVKSFVYDPKTLRLVADLDENNYATFYEYDPEGRLVRIKRETERGIKTIQESRTGLKKTSYNQP